MKLQDKILYMSFGAGLVVLGMVLNSLVSGDADAHVGEEVAKFRYITCESLVLKDENGRHRRFLGWIMMGCNVVNTW